MAFQQVVLRHNRLPLVRLGTAEAVAFPWAIGVAFPLVVRIGREFIVAECGTVCGTAVLFFVEGVAHS